MTQEQKVGTVTDYYVKIGVAGVSLLGGTLRIGDRIHVRGHTTDFTQTVESLQVDHRPVDHADVGHEVALKVRERVRRHDEIFCVRD